MKEIIGIIGAMNVEVATLCAQLENKKTEKISGLEFNQGLLNQKEVVIVRSGVGKVNAAMCVQTLINKFNVTKIINTGIAGAAGKGLGVFDFVVSTEAAYHDVDVQIFGYKIGQIPEQNQFFVADEKMADLFVKTFESTDFSKEHKIVKGRIASGDQFIADKVTKDKIIGKSLGKFNNFGTYLSFIKDNKVMIITLIVGVWAVFSAVETENDTNKLKRFRK
jgi:adenosylhomocysteine nucleosidase